VALTGLAEGLRRALDPHGQQEAWLVRGQ
jgi:hypothetical protein